MSIVKKDKSIFNIFRKKEVKPVMSQNQLDKIKAKPYGHSISNVGTIIYVAICIGIFYGIRYVYLPYSTPYTLMIYNVLVPTIAFIFYMIMRESESTDEEDDEEEYEEEEDDEWKKE